MNKSKKPIINQVEITTMRQLTETYFPSLAEKNIKNDIANYGSVIVMDMLRDISEDLTKVSKPSIKYTIQISQGLCYVLKDNKGTYCNGLNNQYKPEKNGVLMSSISQTVASKNFWYK